MTDSIYSYRMQTSCTGPIGQKLYGGQSLHIMDESGSFIIWIPWVVRTNNLFAKLSSLKNFDFIVTTDGRLFIFMVLKLRNLLFKSTWLSSMILSMFILLGCKLHSQKHIAVAATPGRGAAKDTRRWSSRGRKTAQSACPWLASG